MRNSTTYLAPREAYLALAALSLGFFMNLLDQSIVAVAMPDIMKSFDAGYDTAIWVSSAYFLAYVIPLLVTGRLGDQVGQRRMFITGIVMFTVTSLWCGMSSTIESLIVARFVQGLSAAMIAPQTLAIITRIFPPDKRGPAMGLWGTVAGLAHLTGPVLGGFLVSSAGWEWIFYINIPVGIVCIFLAAKWIPQLPTNSHSFDKAGIVASIVGMSCLIFGIQQGEAVGWDWWVFVLLIVAAIALAAFVKLQSTAAQRGVEALVPLSLFAHRNFSLGAFSIAAMGFAVASNALPVMLYLQQAEEKSALEAGLLFAPMAVVAGVLAPIVGGLIGKFTPRVLSVVGFATMVLGHIAMFWAMRPELHLGWVVVASVILGIGNSFVWAPNSTTAMRDVAEHSAGAASGVYNTTRQVGAVLGSAATAAFIQFRENAGAGSEMFGHVLLMQAVALVLGLIAVSQFVQHSDGQKSGA
ncbi:DHA2 family efflux MFS transporter permease subunit [Corynebacterium sp. H113]|uniref:DHA2 family efflux MFS transporter permease subunit n=1 Tax=Corynebacterium sp. H113 TaxID=3133419 RepID=UPI0030B3CC44